MGDEIVLVEAPGKVLDEGAVVVLADVGGEDADPTVLQRPIVARLWMRRVRMVLIAIAPVFSAAIAAVSIGWKQALRARS